MLLMLGARLVGGRASRWLLPSLRVPGSWESQAPISPPPLPPPPSSSFPPPPPFHSSCAFIRERSQVPPGGTERPPVGWEMWCKAVVGAGGCWWSHGFVKQLLV